MKQLVESDLALIQVLMCMILVLGHSICDLYFVHYDCCLYITACGLTITIVRIGLIHIWSSSTFTSVIWTFYFFTRYLVTYTGILQTTFAACYGLHFPIAHCPLFTCLFYLKVNSLFWNGLLIFYGCKKIAPDNLKNKRKLTGWP